jgi:Holliday junction resolvase RusA-like endonuclease
MIKFTVPLTPISKKNHQQILRSSTTGKPFVAPSKQYRAYEAQAMWFIPKGKVIDFPVNVKCVFYMPTRRRCDLTNLLEAIDDVMVKAGLLSDDNYNVIAGHDGSRVLIDRDNPRTEVEITQIT